MTGNKYYITPRPFSEGNYYLHAGGCPFDSEDGRHTLIGFFGSADDAASACRSMGLNVKECLFCSGSGHSKKKPVESAAEGFIFSGMVFETPESALVCSVN